MCGIAGIISFAQDKPSSGTVREMASLLHHRGPDGQGLESCEKVVFGHQRLSIIDLESGAQPMYSHDNNYLITFNGEIFNYLEIRKELEVLGAQFKSSSDTEVILEAYRFYGPECLEKFNGQFAFAIFDRKEKVTFIARDRIGEKPLYIWSGKDKLIFASEVKSVEHALRSGGDLLKLNRKATFDYFSLNYVPFQNTFFEEILSLKPGCYLLINQGEVAQKQYFNLGNNKRTDTGLREVLERAVELRLRSDVPLGIFLSGGIDSTIVATLAAKQSSNITAFIADFEEAGFSEAQTALEIAKKLGIRSEVVKIKPDPATMPGLIEKLVWHGDEPLADSSSLPFYLLSQETSKHVKVVLSGDGADELFAGYLTYPATLFAKKLPTWLRNCLKLSSSLFAGGGLEGSKVGFFEKAWRFTRNLDLSPGAAHFAWNGMFRNDIKSRIFEPDFFQLLTQEETFEKLADKFLPKKENPLLRDILNADILGYLQNDILAKADRMSMAHGLEVRPVFMDPDVVNFACGLEHSELMRFSKGKIILRDLLKEIAPWYPQNLKKQGFSIPVHRWFRTHLKDYSFEAFNSRDLDHLGIFKRNEILKLWNLHQDKKLNIGFELWGLLVAQIWMRKFVLNTEREKSSEL